MALTYTVTLHQPLNHPDKTVEDELSFPITVEVSDGSLTDTAVLTVEVEDDSPDAKVVNPTVSAIVLDESPVPPNGDGLVSKTVDLSGAFGAVLAFGGDGAGSDSYKFELSSQGIGSGLYELDPTQPDGKGDEILLTSNGDGSIVTGSVNGTTFFTITVDADGKVTFAQENNIWHDDTGDNDDPETLTTDAVDDLKLTQTLTDADGDKDSASVDLGSGVFVIEDDGPKAFDPEDTIVQNKAGATIIGDLDITTHTGSDGLGSIVFGPGTDGQASALKSSGEVIYLFGFGTDTLIGTTDKDNPGDQTDWVFKIELDGATDKYTVTMLDTVDNGSGVVFSDFDNTVAGKDIWVGVDNATNIADPTVEDLLLTAINGTAINTKSTSIGVDNQSVNQAADGKGEGVRIDFVNNVSGTQDVANNWSYDSSIDLNSGSFTIGQLTPTNGDAVVRIRAVDEAFDAKSFNITGNALTGDIQVNLTAADISVKRGLITYSTPAELASIGITVYSMSDGTVVVDGLQVGDETIVTSATTFNRLELVNAANLDVDESASKNIVTGNDWDLSTVSILSFNSGNPVDLSAGVILEDGDGDSVSSTINVQLDPAGASPVINPGTDNPDNINGGTGNDSLDGKAGIDKISGGFGDDAITGGADADTITGGGGNDTINGGAGVDVIDAGDGDDRIVYDASDSSVKGGINADDNLEHAGNLGDVLDISAQVPLDLTAIVNTKYTGFETLEMTGGAGTALKLDASDVIDLGTGMFNPEGALGAAGAKDAIKITGDGTDSVELAGGGWFDVTSQVSDPPVGFKVYAHDSDGDATLTVANINAYVLVENDITTVTGVTP